MTVCTPLDHTQIILDVNILMRLKAGSDLIRQKYVFLEM
jgi:hypothetical protein